MTGKTLVAFLERLAQSPEWISPSWNGNQRLDGCRSDLTRSPPSAALDSGVPRVISRLPTLPSSISSSYAEAAALSKAPPRRPPDPRRRRDWRRPDQLARRRGLAGVGVLEVEWFTGSGSV